VQDAVVVILLFWIEQSSLITRFQKLDDIGLRVWADPEVDVALYDHVVRGADEWQPKYCSEEC